MTIYILLYIYILLLGFVFYKRRPYSVWANTIFAILVFGAMYFIASFAFIVLQRRIGLAQRFGYYFELFLYILIPQFCEMLTKQRDRIIVKSIVLILGSLYFGYALTLHGKGCIPYSFFWQ